MKKQLQELLENNIIDEATAARIRIFYDDKPQEHSNRLLTIFSIIGALLVGLGILLIVAHNWDDFPRPVKVFLAFLPLLMGQGMAGFARFRKADNDGWREGSAVFLCLALGACLALTSQIYHLPGLLTDFLFSWIILSLPIVYVMRSAMVSLLILAGSTWYGLDLSFSYNGTPYHAHWLFFLALMPFIWQLWRTRPTSNFTHWHFFVLGGIALLLLLPFEQNNPKQWLFLAYFLTFNFYYLLPNLSRWQDSWAKTSYRLVGSAGMIIIAILFTFTDMWNGRKSIIWQEGLFSSPIFWISLVLAVACIVLFFRFVQQKRIPKARLEAAFLLFTPLFLLGNILPEIVLVIAFNSLVLLLGINYIRRGIDENHLGLLNYGLLIFMVLTLCRFFDSDWSFVLRGSLFILVGIGFFGLNIWLIRQRNNE